MKRTVFVGTIIFVIIAISIVIILFPKKTKPEISKQSSLKIVEENSKKQVVSIQEAPKNVKEEVNIPVIPKEIIRKADMYSSLPNNQLPLSGIADLADLPEDVGENVDDIIGAARNIYMIKKLDNKVLMLVENPSDSRHNIDLKFISLDNEAETDIPFSSYVAGDESEDDIWEYEDMDETKRPVKHIKYSPDKTIEYTEIWNYSSEQPIKYEMRDGDNKVVSIRKEIIDNETNLREEHISYNQDGSTKASVSIGYSGPEISRFIYFNSTNPAESITIISEFGENGDKTKESVYSSDFKLINTYEPVYNDGIRSGIRILDGKGQEVEKILSK